jgi:hypothetical protein
VVAATVDVVAFAYTVRKRHLRLLIDISGKTGFPATLGAGGLTARSVFPEMESVFTHGSVFLIPAKRNTVLQSAVLAVLQGFSAFQHLKLQN